MNIKLELSGEGKKKQIRNQIRGTYMCLTNR